VLQGESGEDEDNSKGRVNKEDGFWWWGRDLGSERVGELRGEFC
jgi:hypothetical protein